MPSTQSSPAQKPRVARKVAETLRTSTEAGRATVSFEFFPPKAGNAHDAQAANLIRRVAEVRSATCVPRCPAALRRATASPALVSASSLYLLSHSCRHGLLPTACCPREPHHHHRSNPQMGALLRPLFVSLTWRADFTRRSCEPLWLALGARIQAETGLDVMLHLTCHLARDDLEQVLAAARGAGIRNILALRGDAPVTTPCRGGSGAGAHVAAAARRWLPPLGAGGGFSHAAELVALIRELHGDWFCIAVGAYPEVHVEAWNSPDLPPSDQARLTDIMHLRAKQDAGADLIITQFFLDERLEAAWLTQCRAHGITLPILPGYLPIQNFASFTRFTQWCQTTVPPSIHAALSPICNDDDAVKAFGIKLGAEAVHALLHNVDGSGYAPAIDATAPPSKPAATAAAHDGEDVAAAVAAAAAPAVGQQPCKDHNEAQHLAAAVTAASAPAAAGVHGMAAARSPPRSSVFAMYSSTTEPAGVCTAADAAAAPAMGTCASKAVAPSQPAAFRRFTLRLDKAPPSPAAPIAPPGSEPGGGAAAEPVAKPPGTPTTAAAAAAALLRSTATRPQPPPPPPPPADPRWHLDTARCRGHGVRHVHFFTMNLPQVRAEGLPLLRVHALAASGQRRLRWLLQPRSLCAHARFEH